MDIAASRSNHAATDAANPAPAVAPTLKNSVMMQRLCSVTQAPDTLRRSLPADNQCDNPGTNKKKLRNLWQCLGVDGIYFFDDNYKNHNRLNILGHGCVDVDGKGTLAVCLKGRHDNIDGAGLKHLFDQRQNQSNYKYARVIARDSATGENSLGRQVANAFNLETKAFQGMINAPSVENMRRMKFNADFKSTIRSTIDLNQIIESHQFRLVEKKTPTSPGKLVHWTGYHPIKFKPA